MRHEALWGFQLNYRLLFGTILAQLTLGGVRTVGVEQCIANAPQC